MVADVQSVRYHIGQCGATQSVYGKLERGNLGGRKFFSPGDSFTSALSLPCGWEGPDFKLFSVKTTDFGRSSQGSELDARV